MFYGLILLQTCYWIIKTVPVERRRKATTYRFFVLPVAMAGGRVRLFVGGGEL